MTRAQVKNTMTMMKKQCLPKTGATEDKVARIEEGVFIEEHSVMCYIACVYKAIQVVNNDRLDMGLVSKQIDLLYPQNMKEPAKKAAGQCVSIQDKYSDMCEAIFYATKCYYEADPSSFIFP
uniref:Odorant binding protein n=1 Tax=Dendrolimus kikuchii TaxID=765133 RepID=A0A076E5R4_9NEOP|nr:odorant binding protein [Dendrolimus kikuchii]